MWHFGTYLSSPLHARCYNVDLMNTESGSEDTVFLYSYLAYVYEHETARPNDLLSPIIDYAIDRHSKQHFDARSIYLEVRNLCGRDIPEFLIENHLRALAKTDRLMSIEGQRYRVQAPSDAPTTQYDDARGSIEKLLRQFRDFLSKNHERLSNTKATTLFDRIRHYCDRNYELLVPYLEGSSSKAMSTSGNGDQIDLAIEDFLHEVVLESSELLHVFSRIVHGMLLLRVANTMSFSSPGSVAKHVRLKRLYLDTNIVLRIVKLQDDRLNRQGSEFYRLVRNIGYELCIFEDTLHELERLIRGFRQAADYFVTGGLVSHIYQVYKNQGYSKADTQILIDNLHTMLDEMGVTIDRDTSLSADIMTDFDTYTQKLAELKARKQGASDEDLSGEDILFSRYGNAAKHDVRALYLIREVRHPDSCTTFDETNAFFVTADTLLLRFDRNEIERAQDEQLEAIGDSSLGLLLYFRDSRQANNFSAMSFIVAHFNSRKLSVGNWLAYVEAAKDKSARGVLSKKHLAHLLAKTVLSDVDFQQKSIDDLIDAGVKELEDLETVLETTQSTLLQERKHRVRVENQQSKEVAERAVTENEFSEFKNETRKQFQQLRSIFHCLFSLILIFGVVAMLLTPGVMAASITVFGLIAEVLNIVDRFTNWVIKDGSSGA